MKTENIIKDLLNVAHSLSIDAKLSKLLNDAAERLGNYERQLFIINSILSKEEPNESDPLWAVRLVEKIAQRVDLLETALFGEETLYREITMKEILEKVMEMKYNGRF